ncbi:glycine/D-amino acid oxidase-like deaminating enzyme [Bradyrhizobium sp. JR4.1]
MLDMLPVIGHAPRHHGLWLHFGHGHQGFTLGPTTGRLLAELMNGVSSLHFHIVLSATENAAQA